MNWNRCFFIFISLLVILIILDVIVLDYIKGGNAYIGLFLAIFLYSFGKVFIEEVSK